MSKLSRLALLLFSGFAATAFGQVVTATFYGTVTDPNGAVVPNATVTATNVNRGTALSRKTDETGLVTITALPVGEYTFTVEAPGFKTLNRSGLTLSAGDDIRLTLALEIGQLSEKVMVTAEAPLVNASNAEQHTSLEEVRVKNLPTFRRDWTSLLTLNTGISTTGGGVRMNGLPGASFRLTVDGTDATQDNEQPSLGMTGNFNFIKGVATEAIAEVNVTKGIASAEIANTMSGNVNIITKSGTNTFHGSLFALNNTENFNARNQFLANKPGLVYNQYGGSIGGPVVRNKLFFFGTYEGYRQRGFQALNEQVPTQEFRARISAATNIYDKMFSVFPLPNQSYNPTSNTGAWIGAGTEQGSDDHAVVRGDYNLNSTNLLSSRYTRSRPFRLQPRVVTVNNRTFEGKVEQGSINFTHIKPSWTFETRFGFNYNYVPRNDNYYFQYAKDNAFNGITGLGFGINAETLTREGRTWSLEESVSRTIGRHSLKFGGIWFRPHVQRDNTEVPVITYSSIADMTANTPNAGRVTLGVNEYDLTTFTLGFFAQDDFRVNRKLILNIGMRWDYFGVPKERDNRLFNRAQPFGTGAYLPGDQVWQPNRANFAPRVGMAYSFTPKTVLRVGAGMFYSPLPLFAGGVDLVRNAVDEPFRLSYNRAEAQTAGNVLRWPVSNTTVRSFIKGRPSLIGDTAVNTYLPQPFSYQWNLGIQHELPGGIAVDTAYVGTRGVHLQMVRFWNQVDRNTGVRPYQGFSEFRYRDASDSSVFQSWQTSARKRFNAGLVFGVNYTWASAYSYSGDADLLLPTSVQNIYNVAADKGPTNDIVKHNFVSDFVYELPFARFANSSSRISKNLLAGWQISGIMTARTGGAINVLQETAFEGSRADYIGGSTAFGNYRDTLRLLDRSPFSLVPISSVSGAPVRPGNLGRNALWNIGWWNLDTSLAKRFYLTERINGKIEAQMMNAFNKTNLSGVENRVNRANFGQFQSTRGARVIQLSMRLDF